MRVIAFLFLLLLVADSPPYPPDYRPPLHSPKASEQRASLGSAMVRPAPLFTPTGFTITNLAIAGDQVTLAWQQGTPPFNIIGTPSLTDHWSVCYGPVTNQTATFNAGQNHFFQVAGGSQALTNLITILDTDQFGTATNDVYWAAAWIDVKTFTTNACAVLENCNVAGTRKLLRFPVTIWNPSTNCFWSGPVGDYYFFNPCHNHFHITNFSRFSLLSTNSGLSSVALAKEDAASQKMGWCVRSFGPLVNLDWNTNPPIYSCIQPNLMPGWGDTYNFQDCMWLDITGLPDATYTMQIELDPLGVYGFRQQSRHAVRITGTNVTPAAVN